MLAPSHDQPEQDGLTHVERYDRNDTEVRAPELGGEPTARFTPLLAAEDLEAVAPGMDAAAAFAEERDASAPGETTPGKRRAGAAEATPSDKRRPRTPTESPSVKRVREATELAERIADAAHRHGPVMLEYIARSYRVLADRILQGGEIPSAVVSRVGDRPEQYAAALAAGDEQRAARLLAEDIEFKRLYADALNFVRRERMRFPIPKAAEDEWGGLDDDQLAKVAAQYDKAIAKHAAGALFAPEEVSRAYNMRSEYARALADAEAARAAGSAGAAERHEHRAAMILDDDLWYKQAARDAIQEILQGGEKKAA